MTRGKVVLLAGMTLIGLIPTAGPARAQAATEPGATALDRLADSIDRLATLLEREREERADDRQARNVQIAVAILGLRYRKIEQLERRILQISQEEEDFDSRMELMAVDLERIEDQLPPPNDPRREELAIAKSDMELRIKLEEDRLQRLREKKLVLQNDLASEQRRLASLEDLLDEWLESLS